MSSFRFARFECGLVAHQGDRHQSRCWGEPVVTAQCGVRGRATRESVRGGGRPASTLSSLITSCGMPSTKLSSNTVGTWISDSSFSPCETSRAGRNDEDAGDARCPAAPSCRICVSCGRNPRPDRIDRGHITSIEGRRPRRRGPRWQSAGWRYRGARRPISRDWPLLEDCAPRRAAHNRYQRRPAGPW